MTKKQKQVSAKRKVFLDAMRIIKKHQRRDGIDFIKASRDLKKLLNVAPKSGWLAEEWAICSALWASEVPVELPELDKIHEHCVGGQMFLVAFFLGRHDAMLERTET